MLETEVYPKDNNTFIVDARGCEDSDCNLLSISLNYHFGARTFDQPDTFSTCHFVNTLKITHNERQGAMQGPML